MEAKEIFAQLKELGLENSVVVQCMRASRTPTFDWIQSGGIRLRMTPCGYKSFLYRMGRKFARQKPTRLVLICDLFVEVDLSQQKGETVEWTYRRRLSAAIFGMVFCLRRLLENENIVRLLFERTECLVVAIIEDGKTIVQEGHNVQIFNSLFADS